MSLIRALTFASAVVLASGARGAGFVAGAADPHPRNGARYEVLRDGRVLAIGGYQSFIGWEPTAACDIYDPVSDSWSSAEPLPAPRAWHWSAVLKDGQVLVTAGDGGNTPDFPTFDTRAESFLYDPRTGHWSPAAPLPGPALNTHGRMNAIVLDDGRVLVAGGWRFLAHFDANGDFILDDNEILTESYLYTPDRRGGHWTRTGDMNASRATAEMVKLDDGRVLSAGGIADTNFMSSATADVFDPRTGRWNAAPPMPISSNDDYFPFGWNGGSGTFTDATNPDNPGSRWQAASARLGDGTVLIAGGTVFNGPADAFAIRRSAIVYVPWSNHWREVAPMPEQHTGGKAVTLCDGRALVVGTSIFGGFSDDNAFIFAGGKWSAAGALTTDDAVTIFDGTLLSTPAGAVEFAGIDQYTGIGSGQVYRYRANSENCQ